MAVVREISTALASRVTPAERLVIVAMVVVTGRGAARQVLSGGVSGLSGAVLVPLIATA